MIELPKNWSIKALDAYALHVCKAIEDFSRDESLGLEYAATAIGMDRYINPDNKRKVLEILERHLSSDRDAKILPRVAIEPGGEAHWVSVILVLTGSSNVPDGLYATINVADAKVWGVKDQLQIAAHLQSVLLC